MAMAGTDRKTKSGGPGRGNGHRPAADLGLALLGNALILALLLVLFRPYFETNDDTALLTLVNGSKYCADPHMVISGIWLGRLLMGLYGLTGRLPWYTLVQYAMLFVSFTGVTYVLLRRLGRCWGGLMSAWLVIWFGYESYIVIQFSRTAGIASASAMFLLFHAVSAHLPAGCGEDEAETGKRRVGAAGAVCVAAAMLLSLLASWLRFTQFLPCAVLTSGIGLWMLLCLRGEKKWGRALPGLLLPFAAVFVVCLLFRIDDSRSYRQGDVWEDFREFDTRREELYDYGFPDYAANLEVYRSVGISDAGYTLYKGWNFTDPERFTPEVMDVLIAAKEARHLSMQTVKDFIKTVPLKLLTRPFVWFFLFVLVVFFASGKPDRRTLAALVWGLLLFGALYLYLFSNGRYLRSRVDTALVYALVLSVLWFVRPAGVRRAGWIGAALLLAVVFVPGAKQSLRFRAATAKKVEKQVKRRALLEELSEDPRHLYLMKMGALVPNDCYGPFDVMPEKLTGNLLYLGGWAAYTRAFCETMEAYGIENPFRDVIDNETVYLVDNDIELTMTYLRECYAPGAVYEQVGKLQKFGIYRIYTQ